MSQETRSWLNRNVLIGNTDDRGTAWHYRASDQGDEPNHYPSFIPVEDVERRLFDWDPIRLESYVDFPTFDIDGNATVVKMPTGEASFVASDDGTVLGNHSLKYQDHGYKMWLLDNVSRMLSMELGVSSAGLLKKRAVAWVEVSVPETIKTPEGVDFRPNLLACTSLDGSIPTTYKRTVQLTVCDNTLNIARQEEGQEIRVKHTVNSLGKLLEAREALAIVHEDADDFMAELKELTEWRITGKQWNLLLKEVFPIADDAKATAITRAENMRESLTDLWSSHVAVNPWKGTAFGVMQAFNTYRHHYMGMRSTAWDGGKIERNMLNAITGTHGENDAAVIEKLRLVCSNS